MTEKQLLKLLNKFQSDALNKFKRGRKEHKDNLLKLNCDEEMYNEMMDLIIYFFIRKWQEKENEARDAGWWRIWERYEKKDV